MNVIFRPFTPNDWKWVNEQIPLLWVEDTSGIIAVDTDTGEPVGATIFDNWTQNSVQTHFIITSPMVLKHGLLEESYGYIFGFLGKKYMYGLVPGDNEAALKFNTKMGWTEKANRCLKRGLPDGNVHE